MAAVSFYFPSLCFANWPQDWASLGAQTWKWFQSFYLNWWRKKITKTKRPISWNYETFCMIGNRKNADKKKHEDCRNVCNNFNKNLNNTNNVLKKKKITENNVWFFPVLETFPTKSNDNGRNEWDYYRKNVKKKYSLKNSVNIVKKES